MVECGLNKSGKVGLRMAYQFAYREIAEALTLTLSEDPFYITVGNGVSDDPEEAREGMCRYMDYSMKEARQYGELIIPEGDPFGASIWTKPVDFETSKRMSAEKRAFLREHLGVESLKRYREITGFMSEMADGLLPGDCWYLSILGVAPEMRGKGLGEGLVRPVLDRTDKLKVPTFLETFVPRNKSFYERLGYWDAASFVEPVTGAEYWIMFRDPCC